MFDPFLAQLGPLGVALLFAVLMSALMATVLYDVVGRMTATEPRGAGLLSQVRMCGLTTVSTLWQRARGLRLRTLLGAALGRSGLQR